MNPTGQNKKKEKSISVAGVILCVLFTMNVFFSSFYDIFRVCVGIYFGIYHVTFALFSIIQFLLGWIYIPILLIIFIVQAIRFRKNRKYIKNCAFSVLWCILAFLTGCFIRYVSPAIEKMAMNVKIQSYQSTVDKIHSGEKISKYADMTGGIKGMEDVAFFQHSIGVGSTEITECYILYSEDSSCDVASIKKHAKGLPIYNRSTFEMEEIKENWYWFEVIHELNP